MKACLLVAFGCVFPAAAVAQPYPARAVTIIVPAAPGGVTDVLARTLVPPICSSYSGCCKLG